MKTLTLLLTATATVALAGCNQTTGNNSAAANMSAPANATAPALAPTGNSALPTGNDMGGGNGAKPADQPLGDENMMMEEGGAGLNTTR
jgi:hypothetical protein